MKDIPAHLNYSSKLHIEGNIDNIVIFKKYPIVARAWPSGCIVVKINVDNLERKKM